MPDENTPENALVPAERQFASVIRTMDDAERAARAMAASGFFKDSSQVAQAVVKILAGQELGFGPFASMTGVYIIQNKPVLAANLMAAAVKRTGKYNYRVKRLDDKGCELEFYEGTTLVGSSKFTEDDAKRADLLNKDTWKKYPRNMYFARALSNGQKWYAPDVFGGATVYTPEELGAEVDGEGNYIPPVTESTTTETQAQTTLLERIHTAPFMQTHEERGAAGGIPLTNYWKSIKAALSAAAFDTDNKIKELLADFQMTPDLKEWVTGWFRLLERFAHFVKENPDKLEYAKSIVRRGIEAQMDWDGAVETLDMGAAVKPALEPTTEQIPDL